MALLTGNARRECAQGMRAVERAQGRLKRSAPGVIISPPCKFVVTQRYGSDARPARSPRCQHARLDGASGCGLRGRGPSGDKVYVTFRVLESPP